MNVEVSIIIVNFNAGDLLEHCVASIERSITTPYEVIVVDNASTDDSLDFLMAQPHQFPRVHLIKCSANYGFSLANNLGASHARGAWLHFLNPDTRVDAALDLCYRAMLQEGSTACAYTTALKNEADKIQIPAANHW